MASEISQGHTLSQNGTPSTQSAAAQTALVQQATAGNEISEVTGMLNDLCNLLTVILGRSELLLARLPPEDSSWQDVRLIRKMGERAATLSRQLLTLNKQYNPRPIVLDLNSVVKDMEGLLRRQLRQNIQLTLMLDPTLQAIEADPAQVERILLNLAVNACDAMPDGGKLHIETSNMLIQETARDAAPANRNLAPRFYVRLTVSDTGCGMKEEVRQRIFKPFFTTKKAGEGTGLGLFTVSCIVKQCNGAIEVSSQAGKGTAFRIFLPRSTKGSARPASSGAFPALIGGTETILVAEADEYVRDMVRQALTACGYKVLAASNADEAATLARQPHASVQLLLAEIMLPGRNGPQLGDELRTLHPALKVVFMSGQMDETLANYGFHTESIALLRKPISLTILATKVRETLDMA